MLISLTLGKLRVWLSLFICLIGVPLLLSACGPASRATPQISHSFTKTLVNCPFECLGGIGPGQKMEEEALRLSLAKLCGDHADLAQYTNGVTWSCKGDGPIKGGTVLEEVGSISGVNLFTRETYGVHELTDTLGNADYIGLSRPSSEIADCEVSFYWIRHGIIASWHDRSSEATCVELLNGNQIPRNLLIRDFTIVDPETIDDSAVRRGLFVDWPGLEE